MKTIRQILTLGLLGALAAVPALAADAKPKTYTVAGYFERGTPSAELVNKAAKAVGEKMAGMTQTQNAEDADHTVEILFKNGTYQIFVDALPLEKKRLKLETKQVLYDSFREQPERLRDAADGANERH
jgi:hypothetical protein